MLLMFTQKGIFTTTQLDPRKNSIKYSEERQKIRKYIRKDDLATKKKVGVIDWGYLLKSSDGW